MKYFFENEANVTALRAEAQSWVGTPFMMFSRAKGLHGGIDCVGFIEEVTAAVGLERFAFEREAADYSRHVHNDKVLRTIRTNEVITARWEEFMVVDGELGMKPMAGDVLILKDEGARGNGVFHMPIMISSTIFMHCAPRVGVIEGQIDDPTYARHFYAHFRARANPKT